MNWFYALIVFQYTIVLLHGRPEDRSVSVVEELSLEDDNQPLSSLEVDAAVFEVSEQPGDVSNKHLTAHVAVVPPSQSMKRLLPLKSVHAVLSKKIDMNKASTTAQNLGQASTITGKDDLISADRGGGNAVEIPKTTIRTNDSKIKPLLPSTPAPHQTEQNATDDKPTIFDIINETEKNQTLMQQAGLLQPSPLPVPIPSSLPQESQSQPHQTKHANETPKAINHIEIHHGGHPGVAEPLTWQQLESEMTMVDQRLKESSSTSKDGISTWILLSGSDKQQQQPSATPASTATAIGQVDKVNLKETAAATDRHNYRFEEIHQEKFGKPVKHRDLVDNKRQRPEKKNKTTAAPVSSTTSAILLASDLTTETKNTNRRKNQPNNQKSNKRKVTTNSTTTTTTTTTEAPILTTDKDEEEHTSVEKIESSDSATVTTTPVAFIVLEPKDADFDLPQDRSPSTKKPKPSNNSKVKRKPSKKNKIQTTAVTKLPLKTKDKPMTTKIYNYLSREVMPTVGVGLMGLVVTAGLASYFFGPLTALRRSYDDAVDRQDNADSIYAVNSEEYASDSSDSGQNEEEIFGKFIAGMPANYVPKYVKYYKPDAPFPNQPNGPKMSQRRVYGPQVMGPKPNPYLRYRTAPSPHYNSAQYNPQHTAHRNHHMNQQPQVQQPLSPQALSPQVLSPVYDPQYHEIQKQKSFANNMESVLKQQSTVYGKNSDHAITNANTIQEKSIDTDIVAEPEENQQNEEQTENVEVETKNEDDATAQIQRRTNTYVVGSAISDNQPAEAIVSASMTASVDGLPSDTSEHHGAVDPVISVTSASHGPRRRRRRDADSTKNPTVKETPEKEEKVKTESVPNEKTTSTTASPTQTTRLYSATEVQNLSNEFNLLKEKILSFDRDYSNAENKSKIEKKIQTEFKSIEADYDALKKALDGVQAIENFQKQMRIRAKNFELSVTLKTGISNIRQRIKYLVDLVEHPEDMRIVEKINRRDGSNVSNSTQEPSLTSSGVPEAENGFVGFLKLLQLKAQFGLNLLQNIRPSFERAFEEVFKRPYEN